MKRRGWNFAVILSLGILVAASAQAQAPKEFKMATSTMTINLDGKVNPAALAARRDKRLFRYIVNDTPIDYIVDVVTLARWILARRTFSCIWGLQPPDGSEKTEV